MGSFRPWGGADLPHCLLRQAVEDGLARKVGRPLSSVTDGPFGEGFSSLWNGCPSLATLSRLPVPGEVRAGKHPLWTWTEPASSSLSLPPSAVSRAAGGREHDRASLAQASSWNLWGPGEVPRWLQPLPLCCETSVRGTSCVWMAGKDAALPGLHVVRTGAQMAQK